MSNSSLLASTVTPHSHLIFRARHFVTHSPFSLVPSHLILRSTPSPRLHVRRHLFTHFSPSYCSCFSSISDTFSIECHLFLSRRLCLSIATTALRATCLSASLGVALCHRSPPVGRVSSLLSLSDFPPRGSPHIRSSVHFDFYLLETGYRVNQNLIGKHHTSFSGKEFYGARSAPLPRSSVSLHLPSFPCCRLSI